MKRHPDSADYKEELAVSRRTLGGSHLAKGRTDAGEQELREAVRLQEEVIGRRPRDLQSQEYFARFRMALGDLLADTRRPDQAAAEYRDDSGPELGDAQLPQPHPLSGRAGPVPHEARLAAREGRLGRGRGRGRASGSGGDPPVPRPPATGPGDRAARAGDGAINLGVSYGRCDQPARADAEYQKALALLEALVRDNRAVPESLLLLGKTCYNRAFQLRSTGQAQAALAWDARGAGLSG